MNNSKGRIVIILTATISSNGIVNTIIQNPEMRKS